MRLWLSQSAAPQVNMEAEYLASGRTDLDRTAVGHTAAGSRL